MRRSCSRLGIIRNSTVSFITRILISSRIRFWMIFGPKDLIKIRPKGQLHSHNLKKLIIFQPEGYQKYGNSKVSPNSNLKTLIKLIFNLHQ
jgi:hypothetical protein